MALFKSNYIIKFCLVVSFYCKIFFFMWFKKVYFQLKNYLLGRRFCLLGLHLPTPALEHQQNQTHILKVNINKMHKFYASFNLFKVQNG